MKYLLIVLFLFLIQSVYSLCSEEQININSATIQELDELIGIGEAKAQAIIEERVFDSVDDLINVNGIGEATLEKIKNQGLACVGKNINKDSEKEFEKESVTEIKTIKLNAKTFKSSESEKIQEPKNNFLIYGFIGFCFLLGLLFTIRKYRYRKNEFN